jgi:hypothetical protein
MYFCVFKHTDLLTNIGKDSCLHFKHGKMETIEKLRDVSQVMEKVREI